MNRNVFDSKHRLFYRYRGTFYEQATSISAGYLKLAFEVNILNHEHELIFVVLRSWSCQNSRQAQCFLEGCGKIEAEQPSKRAM